MNKGILIAIILLGLMPFSSFSQNSLKLNERNQDNFHVIGFCMRDNGSIEQYEIDKLTHLIFWFTNLQGNKISIKNAEDEDRLKRFVALKEKYPKLKVLISFGGWGGCETCSDVFASDNGRKEFAISVKDLLEKYNADGIDIDWESPVIGGYKNHKSSKADKANFTELIKELRKVLPTESEICFDANSFKEFIDKSIDWNEVMPLVDFVNLMTYGLPNNERGHTGHHTALFSSPFQNESVDIAIHRLDSIGVSMNKIIIGAGFYSQVYENVDSLNNGLGRTGKFKAYMNYNELVDKYTRNEDYEYHWDSISNAPFLYNKQQKTFVTFDDKKSVSLKTKYAIDKQLGGIMFWQLKGDNYREGLLDAIDKTINTHKQ